MTTWVYIQSEPSLWTVGFYSPDGQWHPDSDHDYQEDAAEHVHWLNGGNNSNDMLVSACRIALACLDAQEGKVSSQVWQDAYNAKRTLVAAITESEQRP